MSGFTVDIEIQPIACQVNCVTVPPLVVTLTGPMTSEDAFYCRLLCPADPNVFGPCRTEEYDIHLAEYRHFGNTRFFLFDDLQFRRCGYFRLHVNVYRSGLQGFGYLGSVYTEGFNVSERELTAMTRTPVDAMTQMLITDLRRL